MQMHDTTIPQGMSPSVRKVYEYLVTGRKLTNLVAMANLGVGSLTSRIAELRKLGLDIRDEWREDHARKRYKAYWMAENQSEGE